MSEETETVTLKLQSSMTLAEARDFYDSTKEMLSTGKPDKIIIDAVVNETIELSVLQVLACVVQKAEEMDAKVVWDNPSIALFEKSVELGIDDALGL